MPPGQVKTARSMLQELRVNIVTNAMVGLIHTPHQSCLLMTAHDICHEDVIAVVSPHVNITQQENITHLSCIGFSLTDTICSVTLCRLGQ